MFSSLNSGMIGCVRRLEINDKYYNLGAAMHGGDIIAGQDISKWYCFAKQLLSRILKGNKSITYTFTRVIFMDDYIPLRPDRSLLFGRQISKWWCGHPCK